MDTITRQQIAKILEIPVNGPWVISDKDVERGLYQIRHSPTANTDKWGWIKGIIVNVNSGVMLSLPIGNTPSCKVNQLKPLRDHIKLFHEDGTSMWFPISQLTLKYGFEGIMLNVSKDDGKVIISSRKKIDVSSSFRDNSITFLEMYKTLGGPIETLFTKKYSPFSHRFIVVHPSLFRASKLDVGTGFLVYLGYTKSYEKHPYPEDEVETEPVKVETTSEIIFPIIKPFIYESPKLTVEQANVHLSEGWNPGSKFGEFIILTYQEQQFRIAGDSYLFRWNRRGDDPSLYFRFYKFYDQTLFDPKDEVAMKKFQNKFKDLDYMKPDELVKYFEEREYKFQEWPETGIRCNLNNWADRLLLVWYNLIYISPVSRIPEVLQYYKNFMESRKKLSEFLRNPGDRDLTHAPERLTKLLEELKTAQNPDAEIKTIVKTEPGPSLYKMINFIKKSPTP